jgi:hypothetical protein
MSHVIEDIGSSSSSSSTAIPNFSTASFPHLLFSATSFTSASSSSNRKRKTCSEDEIIRTRIIHSENEGRFPYTARPHRCFQIPESADEDIYLVSFDEIFTMLQHSMREVRVLEQLKIWLICICCVGVS